MAGAGPGILYPVSFPSCLLAVLLGWIGLDWIGGWLDVGIQSLI